MNLLVIFIQIFSSLISIASAYGAWGNAEKFQSIIGIEVDTLQVIFYVSIVITILSIVFGKKFKSSKTGRDTKSQVQIFGSGNKQNMK